MAENRPDRILRVPGDGDDAVFDLAVGRAAPHLVGKTHLDAQPLGHIVYLPGHLLVHGFGIVVPYQPAVLPVYGGEAGLSGRRVGVAPAGLEGRPALGVGQGPILQAVQAAARRPGVVGVGKGPVIVRLVHVAPPPEAVCLGSILAKCARQVRVSDGGGRVKAVLPRLRAPLWPVRFHVRSGSGRGCALLGRLSAAHAIDRRAEPAKYQAGEGPARRRIGQLGQGELCIRVPGRLVRDVVHDVGQALLPGLYAGLLEQVLQGTLPAGPDQVHQVVQGDLLGGRLDYAGDQPAGQSFVCRLALRTQLIHAVGGGDGAHGAQGQGRAHE